jgi:hypothetical protein
MNNINFISIVFFLLSVGCSDYFKSKEQSVIVTITDPNKSQEFSIPLVCKGWCDRGVSVIENTTNDSIQIGGKYFAKRQTGRVFSMEMYGDGTTDWGVYRYKPFKATKGKIVIKFYLLTQDE